MNYFPRYCSTAALCFAALAAMSLPVDCHAQPAAAAPAAQRAATAMELQPLVEKLIRESGISATVCVYVEDAASRAVLANVNGESPLAPASNNKLVTTAAALSLLGPGHKFVTSFYAGGPVNGGTLQGDLIIYGGGDPTISGRFQKDKQDVTATMREWAARLKSAGITSITGRVIADDSYFDDQYFHPNWAPGERGEWYSAEVSALAFNDNCVDVAWSAKNKVPGNSAVYSLNPETSYVDFTSQVTVAAKGRDTERYYNRGAQSNAITATGNMTVDTTNLDSAAVHDGALYTATVFAEVLKKQGIAVTGGANKIRGAASRLSQKQLLFQHQSPSLLTVCEIINQNSQNFYAECVAKALGKEKAGQGTWAAGNAVIENFCKQAGIYSVGHDAVDGSGLAANNRVTGKQLADVLRFMDNNGLKQQWRSTLPIGGERGSLKRRFQGSEKGRAVDERIYGKTGLIGGVRSLSGVLTDAKGREMYYSIILNQLSGREASKGMDLIDNLAIELAASGR